MASGLELCDSSSPYTVKVPGTYGARIVRITMPGTSGIQTHTALRHVAVGRTDGDEPDLSDGRPPGDGGLDHCQGHLPVASYLIPNASNTADNSTTPITKGTRSQPIEPLVSGGSASGVGRGSAAAETATGEVNRPDADVSTVPGGLTEALALATGLNTNPSELSAGNADGPWLIVEGSELGGADGLREGGRLRVGVGDGGGLTDGLGDGVGLGEGLGVSEGLEVWEGLGSSDGFGSARGTAPCEAASLGDSDRRWAAACTGLPRGTKTQMPTINTPTARPLRIGSLGVPMPSGG